MIGNQCPLKADKSQLDYTAIDYGHPDGDQNAGDVYEKSDVKKAEVEDEGAKAAREAAELAKEKKAAERSAELKAHYKKKLVDSKKVRFFIAIWIFEVCNKMYCISTTSKC